MLLDDWDSTVASFVKVTPRDYRRALLELQRRARERPHGGGGVRQSWMPGLLTTGGTADELTLR